MNNLSQEDWQAQCEATPNATIIDVRTEIEREEGYIANSINLDINSGGAFLEKLQDLEKDKPYFVYCKSGGRSSKACKIMAQLGINQAYNLLGGFQDWKGDIAFD